MPRSARTRWYPCDTRPAHPGHYEVLYGKHVLFAFWNCVMWSVPWTSMRVPDHCWDYIAPHQNVTWRGRKTQSK